MDLLGDTPQRFPVYYGSWVGHFVRAELPEALEAAKEMVEMVGHQGDDDAAVVAYRVLATSETVMGRFEKTEDYFEQAFKRYNPDNQMALAQRFGHEPGAAVHIYAALTSGLMGYPERTRTHLALALSIARELQHPLTLGYTLGPWQHCRAPHGRSCPCW